MDFDLSEISIVDNHCHPFPRSRETKPFHKYWTLSLLAQNDNDLRNTLISRLMIKYLSQFLGFNQVVDEQTLVTERDRRYSTDPAGYISSLMINAKINTMIVDFGYPLAGEPLKAEEIDWFVKMTEGVKIRKMVRIERIINHLLKEGLGFSEFAESYLSTLDEASNAEDVVSIKTVIAYYTGLDIERVSNFKASEAYNTFIADSSNLSAEKSVRDFLLHLTLEKCIEHKLPIQIHTGFGDSPICDLRKSNPILLHSIFKDEYFRSIQTILVHTGYPYIAETGYLSNQYPNVWVDVSEMVPFVGTRITNKLLELFSMTPLNKILYGSDGFTIPEISWFSAQYFRHSLKKALNALVEENVVDVNYAMEVATMILNGNARRLYGLD